MIANRAYYGMRGYHCSYECLRADLHIAQLLAIFSTFVDKIDRIVGVSENVEGVAKMDRVTVLCAVSFANFVNSIRARLRHRTLVSTY